MKKNMSEENQNKGDEDLGIGTAPSPNQSGPGEGANGARATGEPQGKGTGDVDLSNYISRQDYEELEKKLGVNSEELGSYRNFFKEISPLLDKLQDSPEVAEAILEGKLTAEMASAILEGKITAGDATKVVEAHQQVKDSMGTEKYKKASSEEVQKLVEDQLRGVDEKIKQATDKFSKDISEIEDKREYENKVQDFIGSVEDFGDYSESVVKWLEDHPTVYDIEVAYYAVKGKALAEKASKDAEIKKAEDQKNMAANAGGGYSQGKQIVQDKNVLDDLIGGRSNPNL